MPEPLQWESPREILSGILITCCIFATAVFIPVIGFFSTIFVPLPILFYRRKLGRQAGMAIGGASIAVMVLVFKALGGLSVDILFFTELLLLGYMLSELSEQRLSLEKTIGYACAVVVASAFAIVYGYSIVNRIGFSQLIANYVTQNLELTLKIYEGMGISPETLDALEASMDRIKYALIRIIPGLATAIMLFVAWSNLLMAKPLFKKQQLAYPDFGRLNCWRAPELLIWGLIGSGILVLLSTGGLRMIGVNGLILMFTVYFFQGMAIVSFFFEEKRIPKMLRIFIYCMIALQQILLLLIIAMGVFDMWLDFRKINKPAA